jgi:hypothetical protein
MHDPAPGFSGRAFAFEACSAGRLGGLHAALEQVKERFEALILIPAARRASGQGETLSDKLFAHIASPGWEHISFNGDYVRPSEPLKQGFRPCEI